MWTNDKYLSECLAAIPFCNLIFCNGNDELIGFRYDSGIMEHPEILFSVSGNSDVYIMKKISERYCVPCHENKVLLHAFIREISQKKNNSEKLLNLLEKYYSRIELCDSEDLEVPAFNLLPDSEAENDFLLQLDHDVLKQFYLSEKKYYVNYSKRAFKKIPTLPQAMITDAGKICRAFIDRLTELAEQNHLELVSENIVFEHEFVLKENDEFWATRNLWIFMDTANQLIRICNCYVCICFKFEEYVSALCWLKSFWSENFKKQKRHLELLKSDLYINQKNYEIAEKSILSLLEQKLKAKGITYNIEFSDKVFAEISIKKDDRKKYDVLIVWNYFSANPKEFSDFLDNPHVLNKCKFWCKETNFKKGDSEKKLSQ